MEKKNKSLHFLQFTNESNKCLRFLSGKLQMFLGSLVGQAVSIENYKKNLSILTNVPKYWYSNTFARKPIPKTYYNDLSL